MNLIVGAGSVGTVLAAMLMRAGQPVRLLVRSQSLSKHQAAKRIRIDRPDEAGFVDLPVPPVSDDLQDMDVEYVFIAVKHRHLDAALASLEGRLPAAATLVPCLNGVGVAERVQARFPEHAVAPMTVMFNARVEAPLRARLTTHAEVLIDSDDARLLSRFEGSAMRVHRAGDRTAWGKLLINLNNAILALTNCGFADLFRDRRLTEVFVRVMDEAVETLDAAGIGYDLPAPVPYRVYRWLLLKAPRIPLFVARVKNGLSDEAYPSMLADLKAGETTEVDAFNGAIVRLAEEHGRTAPRNAELVRLVREVEGKQNIRWYPPAELAEHMRAL